MLSFVFAALGVLLCFATIWSAFVGVFPDFFPGPRVDFASLTAWLVPLLGIGVLGGASCILGLVSLWRIRSSGNALRGRVLASIGVVAGVALIGMFILLVAGTIGGAQPGSSCDLSCNP